MEAVAKATVVGIWEETFSRCGSSTSRAAFLTNLRDIKTKQGYPIEVCMLVVS